LLLNIPVIVIFDLIKPHHDEQALTAAWSSPI